MSVQVGVMSIEEFVRLYDQEGPFELIDGERVKVSPSIAVHVVIIRTVFRLLDAFCAKHKLGEVFSETTFALSPDASWVEGSRVPDVSFYTAQRWAEYLATMPDWLNKPLLLVPDLAVEVISPGDQYSEVQKKVERYSGDGVRLLWVIDPRRQTVTAYAGDHYASLSSDDVLEGGDVLPGLSLPVSTLFPT
jgi:Uma2 family endonuclease